jgi:hypothetical protein
MASIAKACSAIVVMTLVAFFAAIDPAPAITEAVARKCRELAVKAYPRQPPGSKNKGYAQAERNYFRDCVAKDGNVTDDNVKN